MLYIKRNKNGDITALTEKKQAQAEPLDLNKTDVRAWLSQEGHSLTDVTERSLTATDVELVRVLEDLIDVLVNKGVIQLTDLPQAALTKLYTRTNLRQQRNSLQNLIHDDDDKLPL